MGLGLDHLNQLVDVVRRNVDRAEPQVFVAGVEDVVLRLGRHDQRISAPDLVANAVDHDLAAVRLVTKEMVVRGVGFHPDVRTGGQRIQEGCRL